MTPTPTNIPVTESPRKDFELEHTYYLESYRDQVPLRMRNALSQALDQYLVEQGGETSRNKFIELAVIKSLGGPSEIVRLIRGYVERLNRKERLARGESAEEWFIDTNSMRLKQHKTDY